LAPVVASRRGWPGFSLRINLYDQSARSIGTTHALILRNPTTACLHERHWRVT
jgi:hypothetical protein